MNYAASFKPAFSLSVKKIQFSLFALALLLFAGCGSEGTPSSPTDSTSSAMKFKDVHSHARPEEARVTHLSLDIAVDFKTKTLTGTAKWKIAKAAGAKKLVLDTKGLKVNKAVVNGGGSHWIIGPEVPVLGQALEIDIDSSTTEVTIEYSTTNQAAALQWLSPEQTAGKKHPFLFTQSQAILARTWIPCQDGPGIRFTYDARVKVPAELMAVMSASNPTQKNASGVYTFKMEQPVPSYLMALAVGDFAFKPIGQRTGVYAEPVTLPAAHHEFADMEKMLVAAEDLYGKYAWERYDVIVLPPSFPFGGMENPRLTFATPTILAGDRSLTSLVAHELAHSWSGNLVTNATWNDFWLNEGFTVYFERRIMEKLYGRDYYEMLSVLGWQELQGTLEDLMKENPNDTKLKLDLTGRDPDEGLTDIAYEKGNFFLTHIERTIGREKMDAFLRNYFHKHAFKVNTTEAFVEYLNAELIKGDKALAAKLAIDKWIYSPGLPADFAAPTSALFAKVDSTLKLWASGTPPEKLAVQKWSTHEWLHFMRHLPAKMSAAQMTALDKAFKFTTSGNSEILGAWFPHVIANDYQAAFPAMEKFLVNVGRRKFVKPLYADLALTPAHKAWAEKVYQKARPNYHTITQGTIDEILGRKMMN